MTIMINSLYRLYIATYIFILFPRQLFVTNHLTNVSHIISITSSFINIFNFPLTIFITVLHIFHIFIFCLISQRHYRNISLCLSPKRARHYFNDKPHHIDRYTYQEPAFFFIFYKTNFSSLKQRHFL